MIHIDRPVFRASHGRIFGNSITDAAAFQMFEERLSSANDFDGYLNVYGMDEELTVSWTPAMNSYPAHGYCGLRDHWGLRLNGMSLPGRPKHEGMANRVKPIRFSRETEGGEKIWRIN